jgi:hypothetical protein
MNDDGLVQLLLENYTAQYNIYKNLLGNINDGVPTGKETPDMQELIHVLNERKKAFDSIKAIDDRIMPHKIGWDRRKNEIHTVPAETLKTLLRNIKEILAKVMEANDRLEAFMQKVIKNKV